MDERLDAAMQAAERVGEWLAQWPNIAGDREVVDGLTFGDLRLVAGYVAHVALREAAGSSPTLTVEVCNERLTPGHCVRILSLSTGQWPT